MIAYYFPPSGGAGVQRTLKFVKYLPSVGWEPVVLTARDADYPAYDESLLAELPPKLTVYRSYIPEPYQLYRKLTGRQMNEAVDIATLSRDAVQKKKFSERLAEWIRGSFFIPDARVGWLPFAVALGLKAIKHEGIDVIYSSAPPYTCHLIGYWLKKLTGRPWVADFRDSWVGWLSSAKRPKWPDKFDRYLEHSVLKSADRILTVSSGIAQDLGGRHPELVDGRWLLLPNGYDGADFEGVSAYPPNDKMVITYTGSLYGHRNPESLLQALAELLTELPELQQQLQLTFVGRIGGFIEDMLRQPTFQGMVEIIPYVPHQQSIQYLLASHVLLLIIDDAPANKGILTGKLFEYLGARKPILALAPEGDAAELICELKAGIVVHPSNIQQIKEALRNLYLRWKKNELNNAQLDETKVRSFDRRELTRRLGEVMREVGGKIQ
ncbi:MAG: glycosyltransferase family 4 protein [candidate division KSB1 bacterium]|nr:glycosyltransferase family 4 protein [candidate division KSB1 bacterium]